MLRAFRQDKKTAAHPEGRMIRSVVPNPGISSPPQPAAAMLHDCGDRRWGLERRRFAYSFYIPERRSGQDRRQPPRLKPAADCFQP